MTSQERDWQCQCAERNRALLQMWREQIERANRNNIFCHCRRCEYEWVDSSPEVSCSRCGSRDLEQIPCWQFPDG